MPPDAADPNELTGRVLRWYDANARDLPWRQPGTGAWPILVSEVMLQQTPVARVLEPWTRWLERWPTPSALAAEPAGEAVRAWGRLGYPRRALRLHQAAVAITELHGGEVPADHDLLRQLPGIGDYTAAAVASFGFGHRHVVLDTNVRRVLARTVAGAAHPHKTMTVAERATAEAYLPAEPASAARWGYASMELGAVVCTARSPRCTECPVEDLCRWRSAGQPAWDGPPRVGQGYDGTDRQCRGALLAVLRSSDVAVDEAELAAAWTDPVQRDPRQRERCLTSLLADGLVVRSGSGYALP